MEIALSPSSEAIRARDSMRFVASGA